MELAQEKANWEDFASQDPMWAVLSRTDRKYGGWDQDEFYATGEEMIAEIMDHAASFGRPVGHGRALDFGSGLGRLTRALAARFDEAVGVDISQTMVDNATQFNAQIPNVTFQVNARPDLSVFEDGSFDLVNTRIVLQHLPSREVIEGYIAEFLRVMRDDGLLVFQLPSHLPLPVRLQPRRRAYLVLKRLGVPPKLLYWRFGLHPNRMLAIPSDEVVEFLERRGAKVLDVVTRTEPDVHDFEESIYYVTR